MWKGGGGRGAEEVGAGVDRVSESENEESEISTPHPLESKSGILDELHKELCRKVGLSTYCFLIISLNV